MPYMLSKEQPTGNRGTEQFCVSFEALSMHSDVSDFGQKYFIYPPESQEQWQRSQ